ncbi:hypothetical protein [Bifidobacterium aerophilum]|uniref:Secreted protein n=1 Tax=Bifidobacterium aerophilum TaxID=1798155 RepID=A0A6N9Z5B4_9BIFI|nr:hypothetical protein [Bifidobacterium aerophilum]NEG89323.1 hypothetical protein [Bifidobacterium aerophilum]
MFKRLFWIGLGFAAGVIAVSKANAYVKANTPDAMRQFVLGPDQDHVTMRTLEGLVNEFNATRRAREAELNQAYTERAGR